MPRPFNELATLGDSEPFSFGVRLGIVFIIESACVSLLAVLGCLCFIVFSHLRPWSKVQRWTLSTPLHAYFLCMLISEVIKSIGAIMNIRWVIQARIDQGPYCVAQGAIKQIGAVAVALATLAIAIHTFVAIVFHWMPSHPRLLSTFVLTAIWTTIAVIIIASVATHRNDLESYWGNTGYWCWITARYQVQQYALDYAFLWITALASILLYIPLALVLKGWIVISRFTIRIRRREDRSIASAASESMLDHVARQMLFYPFVYIIATLPIAIVRFCSLYNTHNPIPFPWTIVADVLFSLSGLFNIILFSITRPSLLLSRNSNTSSETHPLHSGIVFSTGVPVASPRTSTAALGPLHDDVCHHHLQSRQSPHARHARFHLPTVMSSPLPARPPSQQFSDMFKTDQSIGCEYDLDGFTSTQDKRPATPSAYSHYDA